MRTTLLLLVLLLAFAAAPAAGADEPFLPVTAAATLACDGIGDGTWNGCRGTGCSVCAEKLAGYDCYFQNHPDCILNSTCQGLFYDCDAACPAPTAADVCAQTGDGDGDSIADSFEQTLIGRFAPVVRLYPTDPHRPSSAEWYMQRTHMRFHHSGCSDDQILNKGQITSGNITTQAHRNKSGWPFCSHSGSWEYSDLRSAPSRFFLQIPNDSQESQTRLGAPSSDWTCYAHVRRPPGGLNGYDVQYWIFFPYNGDTSAGAGAHEGDWEHVTAWVSSDGNSLLSMFYSAHDDEGQWYSPTAIYHSSGRPVAYTAWHTHAHYPWPGLWERGILGDDFTANGGPVLDCLGRTINLGERNAALNGKTWLNYGGRWGEIGAFGGGCPICFSGPWSPPVQQFWDGD